MRKSDPNPGQDSDGAAPRSSLVGVIAISLFIIWILWQLVPCSLGVARERARRANCTSNLKQIAYACALYSGDNAEAFPPYLGALLGDYVSDAQLFVCASSGRRRGGECPPGGPLDDENLSYCYVSGLKATDDGDLILAFDEEWNHDGEGLVVAYVGGRVGWANDIETFHAKLDKQQAALEAEGRSMKIVRPSWSRWPEPPPELPAHTGWSWPFWLIVASVALLVIAVSVRAFREYRAWAERI